MKVKFDEPTFKKAGLVWMRQGDLMRIIVPGESYVCEAKIDADGYLDLQPPRSIQHRALAQHLDSFSKS